MSGTCYGLETPNHDGSPYPLVLPHYGPCNPQTDSISHCCKIGDTCLTNGLCVTQVGYHYQGACTDSSLQSAVCSAFCQSGLNHWPVECYGSAVNDGDFCCSINRKTITCCDTASNGLGLTPGFPMAHRVSARPDGANTVPTSVSTGTAPESISSGATTSSSGSITGSLSSSTTSRTDTFDSPVATPLPLRITLGNTGLTILIAIAILLLLISIAWSIKRLYRLKRQQPHTDGIPLNPMGHRREASDRSGSGEPPTEFGVAANEDEDSQFGNEVQGSPVVPVGPLDTGASENPVGPIFTTPSDIAALDVAPDNEPHRTEVEGSQFGADGEGPPIGFTEMDSNETANEPTDLPPPYVAGPDVAPDNNPLRERQAISGSWHSSLFTGSGSGSGSGRATVTYTTRSSATNVNNPTMPMTTCATSTLHRHRHGGDDCPAITENLPPSNVAAPEVAPGNNPLREPQAAVGSWHDPNMGNL